MGYNFGVGREAPQFTLISHDGDLVTLRQYRGDWFPVIVFLPTDPVLAGDTVSAFSAAAGELWGCRAQVLCVVNNDRDGVAALAAGSRKADVPLLADEDGSVARAYGAWDDKRGAVRTGVFIADRSGKLVWAAGGGDEPVKPAEVLAGLRSVAR